MFGYVVVNKPELKFKEFDIYRGYYCGLCRTLRERHGITGQLTLTYDMTFLAMLLSALYEPEVSDEMHRCIAHPTKKQRMIRTKYTDYVADMNVLLSYYKSLDDWKDDKSILKLAFSKLIKRDIPDYKEKDIIDYKHTDTADYREKADAIASLLNELGTREKENETNIDVMAGLFGKIMSILFVPKNDRWAPYLSRMGFFLGKFIYILDAYDDLDKDLKKNRYNPFQLICRKPDFDDRIKSMLTMMMAECSREFEALPILENADILRNILYAGVWNTYYAKLKSKNKQ